MVLDLESGWKHQSQVACFSLVPSRGPLFLFTAILIFCSLVLVTDLSQPEKENWLLVSFLQNFSLSPFSPGLHISLFKLGTAEVITPVFFFFLKFVLIKEFCWPLTCYFKHQISHLLGGLRVPHLHLLGFPPKHRPEHRPVFLGFHPPHCSCSVTALQPFETWLGVKFLL